MFIIKNVMNDLASKIRRSVRKQPDGSLWFDPTDDTEEFDIIMDYAAERFGVSSYSDMKYRRVKTRKGSKIKVWIP